MQTLALSLLLFISSFSAQAADSSYGDLAAKASPAALKNLTSELEKFNEATLPHEAKTLRKLIVALRDQLDLFAYAYAGDRWTKLRKDLDQSYETVGIFKDLYDAQNVETPEEAEYDERKVKKLRKEVLKWKKSFLDPTKLAKTHHYLGSPLLQSLEIRETKNLSRFYWGASAIRAELSKSGLQNLSDLTNDLLKLAIQDHPRAMDLRDLTDHESAESFHDFRKRVRSVVKIVGYFPELMLDTTEVSAELPVLEELVDRYGNINDHIVAHTQAIEARKMNRAKKLAQEIKTLWKEARVWQNERNVVQSLRSFADRLR